MMATAKKTGRDLNEFRASHDKNFIIPKRIQDAITALGADKWEYQVDFIKLAGISVTDMGQFRDQFEDYTVQLKGHNAKIVWCGSKELAKKLRAMI